MGHVPVAPFSTWGVYSPSFASAVRSSVSKYTPTARLDTLAQTVGLPGWNQVTEIVYAGRYEQIADRLTKITVDEQALPHEQIGPTTTARELATLYRMIWLDQAGPAQVCAAVRAAAGHQELTRLALGFDDAATVSVAGKGGRIPGIILTDAGVITFPDRHRYAVAVGHKFDRFQIATAKQSQQATGRP